MHKLNDIIEYIQKDMNLSLSKDRITRFYNMISSPEKRVNSDDKKWVAFVSQASENTTVVNALKEILKVELPSYKWDDIKDFVINCINEVGEIFVLDGIDFKPRIPFYILVLDKIIE